MDQEAQNQSKKSPQESGDQAYTSPSADAEKKKEQGVVNVAEDEIKALTLEEALALYDDAKKYVDTGFRTDWDNYFKVYRGRRVFRNYEAESEIVNREPHTIIETLVANIAGGVVSFRFKQTIEEQSDDTRVLNEMVEYYLDCNRMDLKMQQWVREMLLYGTSILAVSWRDGKPFIENIPLRDFFVDPTSTGLVQTTNPARYAGYVYLGDKRDMAREEIYSDEKDEFVKKYSNLDKLKPKKDAEGGSTSDGGGDHEKMDKEFKDMFRNSTLGEKATENQIFVIVLHDLYTERIYEIGNRQEIIYEDDTWCQREEMTREVMVETEVDGEMQEIKVEQRLDEIKPFLPFVVLRDTIDTSQFYGEGEMAVIIDDAELLNDYESMDHDNSAYQNQPMYWIDPAFADLAPEIETLSGAVYPIPRNALGVIERPQLSNDLDAKKVEIANRMRRTTAADEAVQGVFQDKGRTTATQVSTELQQAQMRFSTKIKNLESEGFAQLGSILFKLIQIFITRETAIRIVGKNGVYFKDYDPWEYNGEYEAIAKLKTTLDNEKMEVGLKRNQIYEIMQERAHFNPVEVDRWMIQQLDPEMDDERFNQMLAPPQEPKQEEPQERINFNYKDAPPFIKAQIEEKFEMKPDPQHQGDMRTKMLEQANRDADLMDPATDVDNNPVAGMEDIVNPQPSQQPAAMSA